MNLIITGECNCYCDYCFAKKYLNESNPVMKLDDIKWIIDTFDENVIKLLGGEPTKHPNLIDIIEYAEHKGKQITIFTNGFLDKQLVDRLKQYDKIHYLYNYSAAKFSDGTGDLTYFLEELGPRSSLGINFNNAFSAKEINKIMDIMRAYNFKKQIRLGITAPSSTYSTSNVTLQNTTFIENLRLLIDTAMEQNINVDHDCSVLEACEISDDLVGKLFKSTGHSSLFFRCDIAVDVFPDLTFSRCFAFYEFKYNLRNFDSSGKLLNFLSRWDQFLTNTKDEKCNGCAVRCQNGCFYTHLRKLRSLDSYPHLRYYETSKSVHIIDTKSLDMLNVDGDFGIDFFNLLKESHSPRDVFDTLKSTKSPEEIKKYHSVIKIILEYLTKHKNL